MLNGDMPASPQPIAANETEFLNSEEYSPGTSGLTKREHFKALAMQGILANHIYMAELTSEARKAGKSPFEYVAIISDGFAAAALEES